MTLFGLQLIDLIVIVGYFAVVMFIGFWASRKVKNDEDFFLGGRRFGKALLMMHWLCTGTHSDQAVQVTGATARVGLGGIWYHWMYLFATPFYWMIAPIIRRLRVITTGDFFRIRYSRGLEMVYSVVAILYLIQSMALLLRGAGAAIDGATGGSVPTEAAVIVLAVMFSTYAVAGGLVAAAHTDFLQGVMIVVLSVMLVPIGLNICGGMEALHAQLSPHMFQIAAPADAIPSETMEGTIGFIIAVSLLALNGVVVQPHVMNATGSGKTELESRVGMCVGNFIKRLLTMAWAFVGLLALVQFSDHLQQAPAESQVKASEELFGMAIREWLGDGWRGLMIACLVAGVTSAEVFMVVGSGILTRNFYRHVVSDRSERHYLWVSRLGSCVILLVSIAVALLAGSVTELVLASVGMIGLLGAAFWLGVVWRRANTIAVWCSLVASIAVWLLTTVKPPASESLSVLRPTAEWIERVGEQLYLAGHSRPVEILIMLAVQFGVMIVVSLSTRPQPAQQLDPFFARLHTPVGREKEVSDPTATTNSQLLHETATLGLHGCPLNYQRASEFAYRRLQRIGVEIPKMRFVDWGGFLAAWMAVGALIGLLIWLASIGA